MEKLFLLKPGFEDSERSTENLFFCPPCALIEGVLSYYPHLRHKLEVHYMDYTRPRQALVELIGEKNQSCPVLILPNGSFLDDADQILNYLARQYGIAHRH